MGGGVFFFVINMSPRRGFYCIEIRLFVALWRNVFRLLICRPYGFEVELTIQKAVNGYGAIAE